MIFRNPAGAPELACDECGCRWFDRMTGHCYECGTPVPAQGLAEYRQALQEFQLGKALCPVVRAAREEAAPSHGQGGSGGG